MTKLEELVGAARQTVRRRREQIPLAQLQAQLTDRGRERPFKEALVAPGISLIAEFKRRSPKDGLLREHADPRHIATLFVDAGAAAISVLTDRRFDGSFEDLRAIRSAVSVPILCKDFILTRGQIVEARREGADAISLIVAALEPPHLRDLLNFAYDVGLQVLASAHDDREVDRAMAAGAKIVGLDARDLYTLEADLDRIIRYRPDVPRSFLYVGESGIQSRKDISRLRAAGVDAVGIGAALMRAEDPGAKLAELMAV